MIICGGSRYRLLLMPEYWKHCLRDLIWWRNHVVAPFTEEYTFRACMIPILLSYFGTKVGRQVRSVVSTTGVPLVTKHAPLQSSILIAPLFFGTAHLHHMLERIRKGQNVKQAVLMSIFQMHYTTIFGMYSAFLFVRTGHLIAPVIVHGFCNFMGFPDFVELWNVEPKKKTIVILTYVIGLFLFCQLLFPLTEPTLYQNTIYSY